MIYSRRLPIALGVLIAILTSCLGGLAATSASSDRTSFASESHAQDPHRKLKEIEAKRRETMERLREARELERRAFKALSKIRHKLNDTTDQLSKSQKKLKRTESSIREVEYGITTTHNQEEKMADLAAQRLRQIYEGQRLGLLEMLFQVSSLGSLLDVFYYQERIASMDKELLQSLRAKASALAANKDKLGAKRNVLGDLVSEIAKKAQQLTQQKDSQEVVAEKMRKQRAAYEAAEHELEIQSQNLERQLAAMTSGAECKDIQKGSGRLAMPLRAPVTSPYGYRRHPLFGVRKFHTGVDLAGPNHVAIRAADSGTVLVSGWYGGYGKVVIIGHGNQMATLYAHLSRHNVHQGQNVSKGDVIGYEGTTGYSTGPHLHFEVRLNGRHRNPLDFLH